jgi:hypothetical protein
MRAAAATILTMICIACSPHSSGIVAGGEKILSSPWPFRPASMRIHPLTRLVRDPQTNVVQIEARLELRDRDGHVARGLGAVEFTLTLDAGAPERSWTFDLLDLQRNRQLYDDVTRTYRFLLGGIDEQMLTDARAAELRVVLTADVMLEAAFALK